LGELNADTPYTDDIKTGKERTKMLRQLIELKDEVVADRFVSTNTELFQGAGLVVSDDQRAEDSESYILVRTPFAYELSALIYRLKGICKDRLDYLSKYEFYGRLGEAAKEACKNRKGKTQMLLDVIDEVIRFAGEVETIKYFAYGSNMDVSQMMERCPSAKSIGVGRLAGYRFALDSEGTATITDCRDSSVWGVVWEITGDDLVVLDRYEGVRAQCYGHSFVSINHDDQDRIVLVYISNRGENRGIMREGYLEKIIKAAALWGFPEKYRDELSELLHQ